MEKEPHPPQRRRKLSLMKKAIILLTISVMLIGGVISWRVLGVSATQNDPCAQAQMNPPSDSLSCIAPHHPDSQLSIAIGTSTPNYNPASTVQPNPLSPSGQSMPVGDLPGWHQVFAEDFTTDAPLGRFLTSSYYSKKFNLYPDDTPDTAGQQGGPSLYYPSKVVSVHNGMLNLHLHTEGGTPMAAALLPIVPNGIYGKYTIRFRLSQPIAGFKTAWLLWPHDYNGGAPIEGEVDFPEGYLSRTINAYMHHRVNSVRDGDVQDAFFTNATYTSWHTASLEWTPNAINFILDGQSIGRSTTGIPNTNMDWVIQTEACLGDHGYTAQSCPNPAASADLQIDWITVYSYKGLV